MFKLKTTWRNASIIGCSTITSITCPPRKALAFATNTCTMVGSGTQYSIISIARKVVAFTKLSTNNLTENKCIFNGKISTKKKKLIRLNYFINCLLQWDLVEPRIHKHHTCMYLYQNNQ